MARVRVDVAAAEPVMKWHDVHGAARGVLYAVIGAGDPDLAAELHDRGWQGSSLRPVGISPPMFARAPRRKGEYTTSKHGSVWFGSPVPTIAAAIMKGLSGLGELRWGGVSLAVRGKEPEWPGDHGSWQAEFASASPVLVKKDSRFLLPGDDGYAQVLTRNLRHKADVLKLPNDVRVEVLDSGPRRTFEVARAMRLGANARVRLTADPALLAALWESGIGLNTVQGFGWLQ